MEGKKNFVINRPKAGFFKKWRRRLLKSSALFFSSFARRSHLTVSCGTRLLPNNALSNRLEKCTQTLRNRGQSLMSLFLKRWSWHFLQRVCGISTKLTPTTQWIHENETAIFCNEWTEAVCQLVTLPWMFHVYSCLLLFPSKFFWGRME